MRALSIAILATTILVSHQGGSIADSGQGTVAADTGSEYGHNCDGKDGAVGPNGKYGTNRRDGGNCTRSDRGPVTVTPVLKTTRTVSGQPIELPKTPELNVAIYKIEPGAELKVHEHPFPRYAYVISGDIEVTNLDTGKTRNFKEGDFIVEAVKQRHKGKNAGEKPTILLVMDQAPAGEKNVISK